MSLWGFDPRRHTLVGEPQRRSVRRGPTRTRADGCATVGGVDLLLPASIPSPSFNTVGPFNLYGLCIALGVLAAVWIAMRRWEERGGDPDDIATIAMWAVPAGVIGSRIYHVVTDWKLYRDDWVGALKITQGGLGIPGGILGGVLAAIVVVRVRKLPLAPLFDVVAPAIPVAQAIGRFGNWFNQEVFGRPTDLPWGLQIDPANRPPRYAASSTFHPTFLYEGLWNIGLALLIVRIGRTRRIPTGHLFTIYVLGYAIGRLWVESLRSDAASLILGLRVNIWMSLIVGGIALVILLFALQRAGIGAGADTGNDAAIAIVDEAGDPVPARTGHLVGTDEADPNDANDAGPGAEGPRSGGGEPDSDGDAGDAVDDPVTGAADPDD